MFKESNNFKKFESKVWLSSPTMHGPEIEYVKEAYETNWMSTVGKNINEVERLACEYIGCKHAVALSAGTASLHLSMKLAGIEAYGMPKVGHGALEGKKVFCSDMTFDATVNPIVYEGGEPVFIDTEYDTWNMDPVALEKAFEIYPDTKIVVTAHLYGTPGKIDELNAIIKKHGAILVEDAAESMGATYKGTQTGTFGKYNTISFNGNKIITGSSGGCFLTNDEEAANKVRKWSTQARENAAWYQHEELGYNYRMSNVVAGVVRGQFPYLDEHIAQKKAIYERYKEGLKDLPVSMNPMDLENSEPNYWLSCLIIDKDAMCKQVRGEQDVCYVKEAGKTCPTEILEAIASINAEGRPIWKPMHMQPIYRLNPFIVRDGNGRARSNAYIAGGVADVGMDIFARGLCLPSDNKMTAEQQDRIIEVIRACFEKSLNRIWRNNMYEKYLKRIIDFSLSLMALIVLSPVLLILIVLGMVFMRGNPFFMQERPGKDEKIFKLIKFRTMDNRKNKEGKLLPDEVRLNKYGRFLRATSLDELPELANIVKGDMSIIGPRPLMARYLDYYTEEERKRHNVRPGLSGYAQVHGRNNVDWSERMKMDIYYAEHISFGMDVKILIDTMLIVLKREGISVEDMTNFDDFRKMQWEEERKEKAGEI